MRRRLLIQEIGYVRSFEPGHTSGTPSFQHIEIIGVNERPSAMAADGLTASYFSFLSWYRFHRAAIAFLAISCRRSGVRFLARAFPPRDPRSFASFETSDGFIALSIRLPWFAIKAHESLLTLYLALRIILSGKYALWRYMMDQPKQRTGEHTWQACTGERKRGRFLRFGG